MAITPARACKVMYPSGYSGGENSSQSINVQNLIYGTFESVTLLGVKFPKRSGCKIRIPSVLSLYLTLDSRWTPICLWLGLFCLWSPKIVSEWEKSGLTIQKYKRRWHKKDVTVSLWHAGLIRLRGGSLNKPASERERGENIHRRGNQDLTFRHNNWAVSFSFSF